MITYQLSLALAFEDSTVAISSEQRWFAAAPYLSGLYSAVVLTTSPDCTPANFSVSPKHPSWPALYRHVQRNTQEPTQVKKEALF